MAQGFDITDSSNTSCLQTSVNVTASSLPSTLGFDFEITYNSAFVRASSVSLAGGLTSGCQFAANLNNPGVAIISIGCGTAVSGSGTIATINFNPVAPGTATLGFQNCQRDETTCSSISGGQIIVSGCPTIALSPTSVGALSGATNQGRACVGATLVNGVPELASTTTDITYDARFLTPTCSMRSAVSSLGKTLSTQLTTGNPNSTLRVTVSGGTSPLPAGALFVCTLRTPDVATLPAGTYPFVSVSSATSTLGGAVGATSGNSSVAITNCNGDCDGKGSVSIGEVQRALNHFNGTALCNPDAPSASCPAADTNNGNSVTIGELQSSLNRFNNGCPAP